MALSLASKFPILAQVISSLARKKLHLSSIENTFKVSSPFGLAAGLDKNAVAFKFLGWSKVRVCRDRDGDVKATARKPKAKNI